MERKLILWEGAIYCVLVALFTLFVVFFIFQGESFAVAFEPQSVRVTGFGGQTATKISGGVITDLEAWASLGYFPSWASPAGSGAVTSVVEEVAPSLAAEVIDAEVIIEEAGMLGGVVEMANPYVDAALGAYWVWQLAGCPGATGGCTPAASSRAVATTNYPEQSTSGIPGTAAHWVDPSKDAADNIGQTTMTNSWVLTQVDDMETSGLSCCTAGYCSYNQDVYTIAVATGGGGGVWLDVREMELLH